MPIRQCQNDKQKFGEVYVLHKQITPAYPCTLGPRLHVTPNQIELQFYLNHFHFTELSHIFFDPSTPDKVSEYDRIKQDLDKSVRENKHLSRQMDQWKRQLAEETSPGKSCSLLNPQLQTSID